MILQPSVRADRISTESVGEISTHQVRKLMPMVICETLQVLCGHKISLKVLRVLLVLLLDPVSVLTERGTGLTTPLS